MLRLFSSHGEEATLLFQNMGSRAGVGSESVVAPWHVESSWTRD